MLERKKERVEMGNRKKKFSDVTEIRLPQEGEKGVAGGLPNAQQKKGGGKYKKRGTSLPSKKKNKKKKNDSGDVSKSSCNKRTTRGLGMRVRGP